ncbi:DUF4214 domain-containing protein [Pigmentiphaga aceris]|nr:DUF4214 domain-containing protein [Pigmentiphaga aceris]
MATITPAHQEAITRLYVGLFNRAPDAQGLQFWAQALADGVSLGTITGSIFSSAESQAIYPATQTADQFVTTFYQTVFGRLPDAGGLRFWTDVLREAGGVESQAAKALITEKIIDIVSDPLATKPADITDAQYAETVKDRDTFSKKVVAGITFAVTQQGTDLGLARQALIDAVAPPASTPNDPVVPVAGQTYTLTAQDDAITGTAGNDTFNSAAGTLQNADVLDGGAGTDTLNIFLSNSGTVTPTLRNIEIINVASTGSGARIDLGASTGVTHVGFISSDSGNNRILNVGNAALSVSDLTRNVNFSGSTATTLSLTLKNVGTTGASIGVNLAETVAAQATAHNITADNAFVALNETTRSADVTTITVAATNTNKLQLSNADAAAVQTLTVTGTGSVEFSRTFLSALKTFTAGDGGVTFVSVNATANVLDITTGAGIDTITANGASIKTLNTGAGNDIVTLNTAGLSATARVNLGAGNDKITLSHGSIRGAEIDAGDGDDIIITGSVIHSDPGTAAIKEIATVTFTRDLLDGETFSIAGLTFTSSGGTTRTQLVNMWKDLVSGATPGAPFNGTLTGYGTTSTSSDSLTFTAQFSGPETDLTTSGTAASAATVVVTTQGAAATLPSIGADKLTGGLGADTFVFSTLDVDTAVSAETAIITDFLPGTDKIAAGTGAAGSSSNFLNAGAGSAASLTDLLTAADNALTGNIKYYVGQVTGGSAYLVTDVNGIGYTNVIELTGVNAGSISFTDIVAWAFPS